jgi:hypothetical protein
VPICSACLKPGEEEDLVECIGLGCHRPMMIRPRRLAQCCAMVLGPLPAAHQTARFPPDKEKFHNYNRYLTD